MLNPLGEQLKVLGGRHEGLLRLLLESKHLATYRGATPTHDLQSRINLALQPGSHAMLRVNHQRFRRQLDTQIRGLSQEIETSIRQIRSGMPKGLVLKDLKDAFLQQYHKAYQLGIKASATGVVVGHTMTSEDQRWVESSWKHEQTYFNRFLDSALRGNLSPSQIRQRAGMYGAAVRGVYEAGRVVGSHPDSLIWWVYNPEAHHCTSCIYLRDQSPYTKRTLPTTPRAGLSECLTNCKCHLRIVLSDPELVKQTEARSLSRAGMLQALQAMKRRSSRRWPDAP